MTKRDLEIPIGKRTPMYRFFEIFPGAVTIGLLLAPVILVFINPLFSALFIIAYIIFWFVRAIGMAFRIVQSHRTMTRASAIDWQERLAELDTPETAVNQYAVARHLRPDQTTHFENLRRIMHNREVYPVSKRITNVLIIAVYNESRATIEPTVEALKNSTFPNDQTAVFFAYEERGPESTKLAVHDLQQKYNKVFKTCQAVMHPKDMPNEVIGKGGNITYAGRQLYEWTKQENIPTEDVIVTTLDSDNRVHHSYLSYVAYEFIVTEKRHNVSYQPIALFLNNIWDVPAPMRVLATGNSFWNMVNSRRPHMLRNFAAHAQSLKALLQTDFWSARTIVEDGHQFWRSYFAFEGDYEVVPINVPVYQDAVLSDTYIKTLKAQFIQLRRWAYGASDIPYVAVRLFSRNRQVGLIDGIGKFLRLLDGHVGWATISIIIGIGAWIPLFLSADANTNIVVHELPNFASILQQIGMVGLFAMIFFSFKMLPKRPTRYKRHRTLWMLAQWLWMPFTAVLYGCAAALYSQIRLMTGRYLDKFDVTDKTVITENSSGKAERISSNH
jgi:cellulose synthase/poly-beta-1,6-N-acetylglucosamine synthase-like glycosyltransferase